MRYKTYKMIQHLILVLIIVITANSTGFSQNNFLTIPDVFANYCKESLLNDFYNNKKGLSDYSSISNNQKYWIVYSDRNENFIYTNEFSSEKKSYKLSFMQPMLVKAVSNYYDDRVNWLHVYSLDSKKELGWVPASNLILSSQPAVLNDKGNTKKAMILVSVSNIDPVHFKEAKEDLKNKVFYSDPKKSYGYLTGKYASRFQIFYRLKTIGSRVLLSQTDILNSSKMDNIQEIVMGWMPNINVTEWDTRICLEPNYGSDVHKEHFNNHRTEIPVFGDTKCEIMGEYIRTFDLTNISNYVIKKENISIRRLSPKYMRMPILNYDACNNTKNVIKVATIANASNPDSIPEPPKELLNVNIVFIVDATLSMKEYYNPISSSIRNIVRERNQFATGEDDVKIKFGLIVYRDYADGKDAYEVYNLTSDANAFSEIVKGVVCKSKDRDTPEAQFNGIINGLNKLNLNKFQSNIIVLIGDDGNRREDKYNVDDVVKVFNKFNASLIAFQTSYDAKYSDDFNDFSYEMIKRSAKKYCNKGENVDFGIIKNNEDITKYLKFSLDNNGLGKFKMFGRYSYAKPEQRVATNVLEKNIFDATNNYLKKVHEEIKVLENLRNGQIGAFSPDLERYLRKYYTDKLKSKGYNDDEIKIIVDDIIGFFKNREGDLSAKGLVMKNYYSLHYDDFYPVVFLSETELELLRQTFIGLSTHTSSIKDFKFALVDQMKAMLGEKNDNVILRMTLNEAYKIILNVNMDSRFAVGGSIIKDLDKPDKKNHEFYDKFVNATSTIISKPYDKTSMFKLAKQKFYWIPLKDFPGYE